MNKAILGLMVFLMVGTAFAHIGQLGEGIEYDPTLKPHGTLEPDNKIGNTDRGVTRNHCDLMEEDCNWRLKYLDSETIEVDNERYYLKYLGDNKMLVINGQYKWINPLRYEGITTLSEEGSINLGEHKATYKVENKNYGDDRIYLTL